MKDFVSSPRGPARAAFWARVSPSPERAFRPMTGTAPQDPQVEERNDDHVCR